MKKIILGMLFMVSVAALAKSPGVIATEPGARVTFNPDDRAQVFGSHRNSITQDAQIVVCPLTMRSSITGDCTDANKQNAWTLLANSAPQGYQVVAYEFRYVGSGGYRILIVYYGKK